MKVTVTKNLNVRVGKPSVNAPCHQFLIPGREIEIDGQLYKGDVFDGVDTWVKDLAGNYYWRGGIEPGEVPNNVARNASPGWSLRILGIDKVWQKTKGAGVRVAIIDTGIDLKNIDLNSGVVEKFNVLNDTENVQDQGYHGTYCASIVGSRGSNKLIGVAPECELIVIKIVEKELAPNVSDLITHEKNRLLGIKKAVELGADIISLSFGSTNENVEMTGVIRSIIQGGKICIAAAGNIRTAGVNYPANIKGMISVGNVACNNFNVLTGRGDFVLSNRSSRGESDPAREGITITAPGDGVSAYGADSAVIPHISGTSFSAAFVSGIAALWLSAIRDKGITPVNNHHEFREFIIRHADSGSASYQRSSWGAGVVNPLKILSL